MLRVVSGIGLDRVAPARLVRIAVFMEEQGFKNEFDDIDAKAFHVVLMDGDKPVATGRTFTEGPNQAYHIGRLAVMPKYRKQHLGAWVVGLLEDHARSVGAVETELSSQVQAKGFYAKLGYSEVGDIYMDEHCPHIRMIKKL